MSENYYYFRLSPDEAADLAAAAHAGLENAYVDRERVKELIKHLEAIVNADELSD